MLVFPEVLLYFWPIIFSHSAIAGVISLTLMSDSSAAVSLSGSLSDPDLLASLPASDPSELELSSALSSEGLLVLPAFLLPSVRLLFLPTLSESCDGFRF